MMTIGDHPDYLALGYLLNQNMLKRGDVVEGRSIMTRSSKSWWCARRRAHQFRGEAEEEDADLRLRPGHRFWRPDGGDRRGSNCPRPNCARAGSTLLTRKINTTPSLYLEAGAIHGCVLCEAATGPWSIWRTSAATTRSTRSPAACGSTHRRRGQDFYTTGRLTSEMVIKTAQMRIPFWSRARASPNGASSWRGKPG